MVMLTKTLLKESLWKTKSIPALPLRLPSTHKLSFIQTLNVTVVVWLQLLVQDTNAQYAKTSTTALPAKKENPILTLSSRSINQDRHQLLSLLQLMRILQERLILSAMLKKIQHSSEIEVLAVLLLELAKVLGLPSLSKT